MTVQKCLIPILSFIAFILPLPEVIAQASTFDSTAVAPPSHRRWLAGGVTVAGYGGSFVLLNQAWYKDYPRSSFHTFDDSGEWQQVDKVGHGWTAYVLSKAGSDLWRWAGVKDQTAVVLGSGSSLLYLLSIEYLDGRSAEWGWSWADVGADFFGVALFAGQQLGWKEQRISMKFSAHKKNYKDPTLQSRANSLFGQSLPERLLKDYNSQTYWISAHPKSLFGWQKFPDWLNISIGYGADGMFGGYENLARDKNGNITFDRREITRYRQWYLAPDVDLTRIRTRSRFLRTVFSMVNVIKFPAPALELSQGKLKVRGIVF